MSINRISASIILIVAGLCGCQTTPTGPVEFTSSGHARALIVNLTRVNPAYYGGWTGKCPGTDKDASRFWSLCFNAGIETTCLADYQATKGAVMAAAEAAFTGLTNGDLMVFFISCHGGQMPDYNGDEEDGQDETICLYDGQLVDDKLADLWQKVPPGVRVFFVSDSCNSKTNFKHGPAKYRRKSLKPTIPRSFAGALIHYGGCPDGQSSYGSDSGGVFTSALNDTYKPGLTYKTWFEQAAKRVDSGQVSQYVEYGNVTDEFRNREALK